MRHTSRVTTARRFGAAAPVAALAAPAAASAAGLRYVSDADPGFSRVRWGKGFRHLDAARRPVRDPDVLARIRKLAIPPAWKDVWICALPNGHLQATGRDSKGRKQYRYHARWREVRDETKYERMIDFARVLPALRARSEADLARPGLPRDKVVAAVVRLLEATLIRVGNEEYARHNRSFGLTTLRSSHVGVQGSKLEFRFRGKSGRDHVIGLRDRRLSTIVKRCRELPGYQLFQYLDERGRRHSIESADVNAYLRGVAGADFTAKDFRTWAGTVLAAGALAAFDRAQNPRQANRNVVRAVESVAARLGNTPTICRKCYVHPAVLESYLDGSLAGTLQAAAAAPRPRGLQPDEAGVLALLVRRLRREVRQVA
jgi:DNA topoisomerase-1